MFGTPKILVEIIDETGIKQKKKFPIESNKIVIRKGKKGPGNIAYKPSFDRDCLLNYQKGFGPFKKLKQKLLLVEGADKCISFKFHKDTAKVDMPVWSRQSEQNLFRASVIKAAGATVQRLQIPVFVYILLFVTAALGFIQLLISTGKIRV